MDAIAQSIIGNHKDEMERDPFIISGLRTLEELRTLLRTFPDAKVVYVSFAVQHEIREVSLA